MLEELFLFFYNICQKLQLFISHLDLENVLLFRPQKIAVIKEWENGLKNKLVIAKEFEIPSNTLWTFIFQFNWH